MQYKRSRGIIVGDVSSTSINFLSNLIKLLTNNNGKVIIIGRNIKHIRKPNTKCFSIDQMIGRSFFDRIFKYFTFNISIACTIIKLHKEVNIWFFFLGGESFLLPIIIARIFNKKVIMLFAGSIEEVGKYRKSYFMIILSKIKKICCKLSTTIILYSPRLIKTCNVEFYYNKVLIAHEHFFDFNFLTITTPLRDRLPIIGYIGRLSPEKGVMPFIQALPLIINDQHDIFVLIGGTGELKKSIEIFLKEKKIIDHVDLPGWISDEDFPEYLNRLKLFVLPSYTEGLPYTLLQAMACGTPVLATPVGAIPDVIVDGKTGFIMENNSPECIADNVIRALTSPDLEEIAENGRLFVQETFSFDMTFEIWKRTLQDIE